MQFEILFPDRESRVRIFQEIDARREKLGITAIQLVSRARIDKSAYCRWRAGSRCPRISNLNALGVALQEIEAEANRKSKRKQNGRR